MVSHLLIFVRGIQTSFYEITVLMSLLCLMGILPVQTQKMQLISDVRKEFTDRTPFKSKKEIFLANRENKQAFINLLGEKLIESEIAVKHAEADADVLIALTAVESSHTRPTILLGEDTDLLVLLLYHGDTSLNQIYFKSLSTSKVTMKSLDILKTKALLGPEICSLLSLVHAISGCDTASRMFGIGKGFTFKKLEESLFC